MNMPISGSMEHLFQSLPELAAGAPTRAVELEDNRQISIDIVVKLKQAGAYRILVARGTGQPGRQPMPRPIGPAPMAPS